MRPSTGHQPAAQLAPVDILDLALPSAPVALGPSCSLGEVGGFGTSSSSCTASSAGSGSSSGVSSGSSVVSASARSAPRWGFGRGPGASPSSALLRGYGQGKAGAAGPRPKGGAGATGGMQWTRAGRAQASHASRLSLAGWSAAKRQHAATKQRASQTSAPSRWATTDTEVASGRDATRPAAAWHDRVAFGVHVLARARARAPPHCAVPHPAPHPVPRPSEKWS